MARRTKADALRTREALLDAAERLFQQQGVSGTSLAEIARAASVTRGAVYWHFDGKASLLNAMLDRITLPLSEDLDAIIQREADPLPAWCAHLQDALHQIVHNARTRRVLQIIMQKVEHARDMGPATEHHIHMQRTHVENNRLVLERTAAARGMQLPAPATELARAFDAMIGGLIYSWLLAPDFDLEQTGRTCITTFLRGIGLPSECLSSSIVDNGKLTRS